MNEPTHETTRELSDAEIARANLLLKSLESGWRVEISLALNDIAAMVINGDLNVPDAVLSLAVPSRMLPPARCGLRIVTRNAKRHLKHFDAFEESLDAEETAVAHEAIRKGEDKFRAELEAARDAENLEPFRVNGELLWLTVRRAEDGTGLLVVDKHPPNSDPTPKNDPK